MTFIKKMMLTPSQAHGLVKQGFILTLVKMYCREYDEYEVYVV